MFTIAPLFFTTMPLLSIGIVVLDQRPLGVGQAPQWRGAKAPMERVKGGPEIAKMQDTLRRAKVIKELLGRPLDPILGD